VVEVEEVEEAHDAFRSIAFAPAFRIRLPPEGRAEGDPASPFSPGTAVHCRGQTVLRRVPTMPS